MMMNIRCWFPFHNLFHWILVSMHKRFKCTGNMSYIRVFILHIVWLAFPWLVFALSRKMILFWYLEQNLYPCWTLYTSRVPFSTCISAELSFNVNILCQSFVSLFFMQATSAVINYMTWAILKASSYDISSDNYLFSISYHLSHAQICLVMLFLKMSQICMSSINVSSEQRN